MSNTRSPREMPPPGTSRPADWRAVGTGTLPEGPAVPAAVTLPGGPAGGLPAALVEAVAELDGPGLLALVREGVQALAGQVLTVDAVNDVALARRVEALARLETAVLAEKLRCVEALRQRGAHETVGARSTIDFLSDRLGLTRGEARQIQDTAKALAQLPKTAASLAQGSLGAGQANVVAAKLAEVAGGMFATASPEQAAALDDLVTGHTAHAAATGRRFDRRELRVRIDQAAETLRPGILEEREARLWRQRGVRIWDDPDGALNIQGRFDALGSAAVRTALNTLARPTSTQDDRDPAQRTADAVVELARRALDTSVELPESGKQRPHVLLLTTRDTLLGLPEADPSLLDGYGPVSSALAAMIACDAEITNVVTDRNGQILDVGRAHRDPTRRQRAAVIARDRACIGCAAPISRCEIHHIKWWSNNGRTDLDNLTLVCWTCHHRIHHDHWQVVRDPHTGEYTLQPPEHPVTGRSRPARHAGALPAAHRRTA